MNNYIIPIEVGIIIFPIIALLITLPYLIYEYHKYGSISFLRTSIVYSFLLYILIAYLIVILPLPSIEEVNDLTTPIMQLHPFNFISDFINKCSVNLTDINSYIIIIKNPAFYTVFFNLLLTMPFGIYLKYYFKCSTIKTIFFTFILSMFFEITQLTGIYGIYPRPYRLFDIDDLIINTLGGGLGAILAPILCHYLPNRDQIDEMAYIKGTKVSPLRKLLSFCFDYLFIIIITILVNNFFNWNFELMIILISINWFIIIPVLTNGNTIGKRILQIKMQTTKANNNKIKLYQYIIKYVLFYFLYIYSINIVIWMATFLTPNNDIMSQLIISIAISAIIIYDIAVTLNIFINSFIKKEELFYERISNIKDISIIKIPDNEKQEI
ncbi:MAG: VanZ family protein [Bacilli bacterium]